MRYKIISTSKYGTEVIDTASSLKEAEYLTQEYQMAFGKEYTITFKNDKYVYNSNGCRNV
mgnify:CR=1 FL=1|tara:strand:- start:621 stop:800 length:180 start_codon:yes stop_codon:yes gene_type:complete